MSFGIETSVSGKRRERKDGRRKGETGDVREECYHLHMPREGETVPSAVSPSKWSQAEARSQVFICVPCMAGTHVLGL